MRPILQNELNVIAVLAACLVLLSLFQLGFQPRQWVYPIVRLATQGKTAYENRNLLSHETEHFVIKYKESDAAVVDMVAAAAEQAYTPVTGMFAYVPQGKTMVILYHDRSEMRQAFGWSGDESAMGVYWGGGIQLLSPSAWMKTGQSTHEFVQAGPMVHEFTHLVFDYMTNGNYPRWFTEGLAQYAEYRINNYEWRTASNSLDGNLYSMEQLTADFDNLPNQSLAYRESLAAVRYIAEVHGEDKLQAIIQELHKGRSLESAVSKVLNMDYQTFASAWPEWAKTQMKFK